MPGYRSQRFGKRLQRVSWCCNRQGVALPWGNRIDEQAAICADLLLGDKTMRSAASGFLPLFIRLLLVLLLPAGALAAQARSSLEVSVQVVRGSSSAAVATLMETAQTRHSASPAISSAAECRAIGSAVIADDVWATCGWDPDGHVYLLTVQY